MILYYAAASKPYWEMIARNNCKPLFTYAMPREAVEFIKRYPDTNIFLDSGAYTAFTTGLEIDIDQYIEFIKQTEKHLDAYVTLDVINNPTATKENLEYLESRGMKPMPVFQYKGTRDQLEDLIAKYDYIALGGLVSLNSSKNRLIPWLDFCFSIIRDRIKVHGLGMTAAWLWDRYPFYSVDSTSWLTPSKFGKFLMQDGMHSRESQNLHGARLRSKDYLELTEIQLKEYKRLADENTELWKARGVSWT